MGRSVARTVDIRGVKFGSGVLTLHLSNPSSAQKLELLTLQALRFLTRVSCGFSLTA